MQGRGSGPVLAKDAEHRFLHRGNRVPAWIRLRRIPSQLTTRRHKTHGRIDVAGPQVPAAEKVSKVCFTPRDLERLLLNADIVRHRGKIETVIYNAGRARETVIREGSLAAFFWTDEAEATGLSAVL